MIVDILTLIQHNVIKEDAVIINFLDMLLVIIQLNHLLVDKLILMVEMDQDLLRNFSPKCMQIYSKILIFKEKVVYKMQMITIFQLATMIL
jgi:hypothetical protein